MDSATEVSRLREWIDWAVKGSIIAILGLVWSIHVQIREQQYKLLELENRVTRIESQMVGWDTLTRIERSLGWLANNGKGNEAMLSVVEAIKSEREIREKNR